MKLRSSGTEPRPRLRIRRRGQAAVETMLMAFGIVVIVVAMFHLFTVTWATSNAHLRAREALLHGDAYLSGETKNDYVEAGSTPFDPDTRQYDKARPDAPIMFNARAWDTTRDDLIGSDVIQVRIEMTN